MPRSIGPVKQGYRADVETDPISRADIPVDGDSGSMYAELRGRLNVSPDIVTVTLSDYLPVLLKIGIYWQNYLTCICQ